MKAVVDTNVFISAALIGDSQPDRVLQAWRADGFELITSPALLNELSSVMNRSRIQDRLGWTDDEIAAFIGQVSRDGKTFHPTERLSVLTDEADNRLLEAAAAAEADYIVSGDAALVTLGSYQGTEVVSPARFLAILAAS